MIQSDTIAAIATPPIPSAIGIIRVSGTEVLNILKKLFKINPTNIEPRKIITTYIYTSTNKPIDECCFIFYKNPKSYTGEDGLEIFSHGSIYILKEIISEICKIENCRLAKNGEFTQRAFLNGKISLNKAESIIDIIESNSRNAHEIALNQYQGHVYKKIKEIRQNLMHCLEKVEASLEFPDEVGSIKNTSVENELKITYKHLEKIINNSDYGTLIKKGITYLIIGKPNVGKSSLLNCLSGEERSIISKVPGTTRDYIDITIEYQGIVIQLIDTAGIRDKANEIEKIGIDKIKNLSKNADGYIVVQDTNDSKDILPNYIDKNKPLINVTNKIDKIKNHQFKNDEPTSYFISCKENIGIDQLKNGMVKLFFDESKFEPLEMLSNIRQLTALKQSFELIDRCLINLNKKKTLDIISIDLRESIHCLSDILGEDFTEELLDEIFKNFCIGK